MRLQDFLDGLNLLRTYTDDEFPLGAEHDVFYFYPTTRPITPEDCEKLWDLGWAQTDAEIVEGERVRVYDPDSAWECFT